MSRWLWSCISLVVISCSSSSGSGVSSSKKLVELSASEETELCAYVLDAAGGARVVTCSDGSKVTISSEGMCDYDTLKASCTATVGEAETCAESFGKDACAPDLNACLALFACAE